MLILSLLLLPLIPQNTASSLPLLPHHLQICKFSQKPHQNRVEINAEDFMLVKHLNQLNIINFDYLGTDGNAVQLV